MPAASSPQASDAPPAKRRKTTEKPVDPRVVSARQRHGVEGLLAIADRFGATGTGAVRRCPLCTTDSSFTASLHTIGYPTWECSADGCKRTGDIVDLYMDVCGGLTLEEALADLLDEEVSPGPVSTASPVTRAATDPGKTDGAKAWSELAVQPDADAWEYLRGRGLDEAVDLGLVRFNLAQTQHADSYVTWLASLGYAVCVPLVNASGEVVSFQSRHIGVPALPVRDGKALPSKMSLKGPSPRAWFGNPHMAATAPVVLISEGMFDTLALQVALVEVLKEIDNAPSFTAVIGSPGVKFLRTVLPQLGVMHGRRFVLCPQRDPKGTSQAAFEALRQAIVEQGGVVRVFWPAEPAKDPADAFKADRAGFIAALEAVIRAPEQDAQAQAGVSAPARKLAMVVPLRSVGGAGSTGSGDGDDGTAELGRFKPFPRTDLGNAERLVAKHGDDLHYIHGWSQWMIFDGTRWVPDQSGAIRRLAYDVARTVTDEKNWTQDSGIRAELDEWAEECESRGRLNSMVDLATALEGVPVKADAFDRDPWLLNVTNGTLDLKTGALRPHDRDDLLAKMAGPAPDAVFSNSSAARTLPLAYDPSAECPRWEQFLLEVFDQNTDLIDYVQRAVGYSLTGITSEHCLFILHGDGRNGKGTLRDILRAMMGEYAHEADFSTFEPSKADAAGQPREDLVDLMGRRFVAASEQEKGKRVDEALIKRLTGEDPIRARRLHENGTTPFVPVAKYWLLVNDLPNIRGTDVGIWSRIRKIPFEVQFEEKVADAKVGEKGNDPQKPAMDKGLRTALMAELPGILTWAVKGCVAWQATGMKIPQQVKDATDDYQWSQDAMGQWLASHMEEDDEEAIAANPALPRNDPGTWIRNQIAKLERPKRKDSRRFLPVKGLYEDYVQWCGTGARPLPQAAFTNDLNKRAASLRIEAVHKTNGNGYSLLPTDEPPVATQQSLLTPEPPRTH